MFTKQIYKTFKLFNIIKKLIMEEVKEIKALTTKVYNLIKVGNKSLS